MKRIYISSENLHGWLNTVFAGRLFTSCSKSSHRNFSRRPSCFKSCPSGCLSRAVFGLSEVETRSVRLTQADQRLMEKDLSHSWAIHILCDRTNTPALCQQRKNHFPKEAFSLDRYIKRRQSRVTSSICSSLGTRRNTMSARRPLHPGRPISPMGCVPVPALLLSTRSWHPM